MVGWDLENMNGSNIERNHLLNPIDEVETLVGETLFIFDVDVFSGRLNEIASECFIHHLKISCIFLYILF